MSLTSLTTPVLPNNWKLGWRLATSAVAADTGQASTIRRSYESKIATEARLTNTPFTSEASDAMNLVQVAIKAILWINSSGLSMAAKTTPRPAKSSRDLFHNPAITATKAPRTV